MLCSVSVISTWWYINFFGFIWSKSLIVDIYQSRLVVYFWNDSLIVVDEFWIHGISRAFSIIRIIKIVAGLLISCEIFLARTIFFHSLGLFLIKHCFSCRLKLFYPLYWWHTRSLRRLLAAAAAADDHYDAHSESECSRTDNYLCLRYL